MMVQELNTSFHTTTFLSQHNVFSPGEDTEVKAFCLMEVSPLPCQCLKVGESRGKHLLIHSPTATKEFRQFWLHLFIYFFAEPL